VLNIVKYNDVPEGIVEKRFVADLTAGESVSSEFLVREKSLVPFNQANRAGEQFLRLQLSDITGAIRAVAWDKGPELAEKFQVGDVIRVRAEVGNYRGPQLVIYGLEVLPESEIDRRYFQPSSPRTAGEMMAELQMVIGEVSDPNLQKLMESLFADELFLAQYANAPAARTVHHNYIGGLLEHSLEVANLCRHFAGLYPALNRSLLLCGALLHDVGKIEEYDALSMSFELTTRGKLLGHIALGIEILEQRITSHTDFPAELKLELIHMILSHHGQKEWGSPEVPRTFTAFALHYADLVSARLHQFARVAGQSGNEYGWTQFDRLLERDVYLGIAQ
jgi:3'-5' exoribonuclease